MSDKKTGTLQSYLTFRLGQEVFAAHVSKVLNILEMQHITKVPQAPDYMKGVINLRGKVLPVVDLRIKFSMPATEETVDTCIIVLNFELEGETIMLGALVDAVREVLEISDDNIDPSPSIGTKYNTNFMQGMYRVDENFIMILDIDRVFSLDEQLHLAEHTTTTQTEI